MGPSDSSCCDKQPRDLFPLANYYDDPGPVPTSTVLEVDPPSGYNTLSASSTVQTSGDSSSQTSLGYTSSTTSQTSRDSSSQTSLDLTSSTTSTPSSMTPSDTAQVASDNHLGLGLGVGLGVGIPLVAALVAGAMFRRRKQRRSQDRTQEIDTKVN